jgi:hypothetical protein
VVNTSRAPAASQAAWTRAISSAHAAPGASDCTISSAAVSRSSPIGVKSSIALMAALSINSIIEGRITCRIATTAAAQSATESKDATSVEAGRGAGTSRKIARVTMPSVPSEPTKSFSSDSPATSLIRLPPSVIRVPSASTTSRPST